MIHKIDNSRVREVMRKLQELKSDFRLDQLDCRRSFLREKTDKSLEEILDLFDAGEGFKMFDAVLRQGIYWGKPDFYEICLSVDCGGVEYFVWADVSIKDYQKYIQQ